jgi:YHS domain-containing protein
MILTFASAFPVLCVLPKITLFKKSIVSSHKCKNTFDSTKRRLSMLKPFSKIEKWCFTGALVLALFTVGTTPGIAFDKFNQTFGIAIHGYDTVAYHTENSAVKGKSEFSYEWNDAEWHFASAENRDLFAADPDRYAPQYGGY